MKILIIRLSAIGDTIHSLPVAAALKSHIPSCEITWLVEPASASLLENNPAIDRVLVLDKKSWVKSIANPGQWPATFTAIGALSGRLRSAAFDLAVDLQGLLKSGVWATICGAPWRVGFAHAREGAGLFLTDRVDVGDYFGFDRHVVDLNLAVVDHIIKKVGITGGVQSESSTGSLTAEFPLPAPPDESLRKIQRALDGPISASPEHDISMVRNAVLIPGTTWPSKIWDWQSWARLAQYLAVELGFRVCVVGGASERATNSGIIDWLRRECPQAAVTDLTGQTSLLDLIALFQRSDLVVGGDTGPLHLAAATGKPKVVGVYGSTPVKRNGPYGPQCSTVSLDLSCQPCFQKDCPLSTTACLKDLTPERVFAEVKEALKN